MTETKPPKLRHPATWSRADLAMLDSIVPSGLYLDCCAGVGKIYRIERPDRCFVTVEIEKPWADVEPRTICGDMFDVVQEWITDGTRFDGIVVSWVFGNRMSDSHKAKDTSRRHSYTHDIRTMTGDHDYQLHANNAGTMYFWNDDYKEWHERAYTLLRKVVGTDKTSFFNVKNFKRTPKRGGEQITEPVVGWHIGALKRCGWEIVKVHHYGALGVKHGENSEARVNSQVIIEARRA